MTLTDFAIVYAGCLVTMVGFRCIPIFVLKGRDMPDNLQSALNLIPPAAFAALVANDLYKPGMFDAGLWPALMPLVAALAVIVVASRTKSLVWCAITGVVSYALLMVL